MKSIRYAFTLLELLLVITIISSVGVVASGFMSRFVRQNEVANTVDQLAGSFRKAQIYSMMGKYNGSYTTWGVNYSASTITLFVKDPSSGIKNAAFNETYTVSSSVAISGFSEVAFDRMTGIPNPATPLTITVLGGNTTKTLTMNAQGIISK